jgi:predicted ATPase/DNA-binding CsgD family transcriptional regulator
MVRAETVTWYADGHEHQLAVDTPAWYAWLEEVSTFAFVSDMGTFTVRKEPRQHGGVYWRAYRKRDGKLHRAYLGKSHDVTLERLNAVAAMLSGKGNTPDRWASGNETLQIHHASITPQPPNVIVTQRLTSPESAPKHNLPPQLTSLIGRKQDAAAAEKLLQRPQMRLLTLTGPAGVGKTRLALRIATDLLESYPDGVYFVPLASLRDSDQVLLTIAQTLALREIGGQTFQVLLKASLQHKHLLLVLDNFEQVITAAPLLTELLETCPELKLLVTSREVLHLRAEHQFPIPPLALPDLTHLPADEALAQYAAVDLFLQRAQAIKPSFQLTSTNARSVAEICIRLDGLPLAIELAAARIKLLTPQALLARLSHRLRVLTSGTRDVPARQQTLRNTIEWSYNLLGATEQRLFRQLSVFVGGCTLEGVEAVCAMLGEEEELVLDGVASLADKSLLLQREREKGEFRLMMLETIREYALEVLAAKGEEEATRQAHAIYYLHLAERGTPMLVGEQQAVWYERLEQEYENLRVALHWLLERKEAEQALRLCTALWMFWLVEGYWSEGRSFLERALTASGGVVTSLRAAALNGLGLLLLDQWDLELAERRLEESLALYRELGDTGNIGKPLHNLGLVALSQGAYSRASQLLEESLIRSREGGDKTDCAFVLCNLTELYQARGEFDTARSCAEESLALFRKLKDNFGISHALLALARVLFVSQGNIVAVDALLEECRTRLSQSGVHEMWMAGANHLAAVVALSQGDIDRARSIIKESLAFYRAKGYQQDMADSLVNLGMVATAEGDYAAAQACYEESLVIAREIGYKPLIPPGLEGLAVVAAAQGAFAWAARLWGAAENLRENMGTTIPPVESAAYERSVAAVRAQVGEAIFASEWAQGRAMTPEQVLSMQGRATMPMPVSPEASPVPQTRSEASLAGLTPREVEILRLLAQGLTSAQIAERLVIGVVTVNFHVRSIYSKLEVASRAAATRYAIEHHLV